jgi:hypothetical protein
MKESGWILSRGDTFHSREGSLRRELFDDLAPRCRLHSFPLELFDRGRTALASQAFQQGHFTNLKEPVQRMTRHIQLFEIAYTQTRIGLKSEADF